MLDKGKAAAVTSITETKDKATGKVIFENQSTVFIRGAGGFGGKRTGKGASSYLFCTAPRAAHTGTPELADVTLPPDRGAASAANTPPQRKPDAILEEKTLPIQAALYRYVTICAGPT